MAMADSSEPTVSNRPSWGSRELATARSVMVSETMAKMIGMANSQGQVK